MPRAALLLAPLAILAAACSRPPPAPTSPEARARWVAEGVKPAFDEVEAWESADHPDGKPGDAVKPFDTLPGRRGSWSFTVVRPAATEDIDALAREDFPTEPAEAYRFEDLDLTCWSMPDGGERTGMKFGPGWLVMRLLSSEKMDDPKDKEQPYWVTYAVLHVTEMNGVKIR